MGMAHMLGLEEARTLIALTGELGEIRDQGLRGRHLAERLCGVFHAKVCCIGEVPRRSRDHAMPWVPYAEHGWLDSAQRRALFAAVDDPQSEDVMMLRLAGCHDAELTGSRRELVSDDDWYASRYTAEHRANAGLDDQLFSVSASLERDGWLGVIGLHRERNDRPFAENESLMLKALHSALALKFWRGALRTGGTGSAAGESEGWATLTDAQRRLLPFLVQGLSEREIAERIGRSRHTVHDHVLAIYRQLQVRNRVELVLKAREDGFDGPIPPETK